MLAQTSILTLKQGSFRLQFFGYPDGNSLVKPLPVDVKHPTYIKQKLYVSIKNDKNPFKKGVWLSPLRAFDLYFFLQKFFLGEEAKPVSIVDEDSVLRFYVDSEKGSLFMGVESGQGENRWSGRVRFDHEEVIAFMSFLKTFAIFGLFVSGQDETVLFQKWGMDYLIVYPITVSIPDSKRIKAIEFLNNFKQGKYEELKPVIFKDLYAFKYVPEEGIFLTAPTENIRIDNHLIEKFLLFFSAV